MLEQGFANKACGFKLPIFPDPSSVIFPTWSRTSFFRYALFYQLVAPLTYLTSSSAQTVVREARDMRERRDLKFEVRGSSS
jgi:hypothetical protein